MVHSLRRSTTLGRRREDIAAPQPPLVHQKFIFVLPTVRTAASGGLPSAVTLGRVTTAGSQLEQLDDSKITRFQMKIMFVSGMGFFTDAYDLFVIGIVVALLKPQWGLTTAQVSCSTRPPWRSAVGAIVFGRVADILGRKRIYGYEVLILAVGAIASAFAPNYTFLLVAGIVLGIGIGGDYPVSATIMSEYSGKQTGADGRPGVRHAGRGPDRRAPGGLRSCWPRASSDNLVWRILLGLGAIPGLAVSISAVRSTRRPGSPSPAATRRPTGHRRATGTPRPTGHGPPGRARRSSEQPQAAWSGFHEMARHGGC